MVAPIFGKDPADTAWKSGLGAAIGSFIPGVGPLVGGIIGGLFGKKKKKQTETKDPNKDTYGMPDFEWESYLYGLYKDTHGLSAYHLGSTSEWRVSDRASSGSPVVVSNSSVGTVVINVNGGDTAAVRRVVDDALKANFGSIAQATVNPVAVSL
jgi:hypothetical protein